MTRTVDLPPGASQEQAHSATGEALTFAVVSSSSSAKGHLDALCQNLSRALSRPVSARVLPSYTALKQDVEAGRAQIAWAPPLVAIELEDANLASLALCCARGGQVDYYAALFTQHASPIEKLADLQGTRMAWVDEHSSAGYLVPRARLFAEGLDPGSLFREESFVGTHARVARAVLEGDVDAGATYLQVDPGTGRPLSAGWLEAGAGINGAFILAKAGPIPSDVIVFANGLPAELKTTIADRMMALPSRMPEAVGRLLGADGFMLPRASHFQALRASTAARKKW